MPAGIPTTQYLKALTAFMLAMFAGSQTVHMIYNPLKDMDLLVAREKKRILQEEAMAQKKEQEEQNKKVVTL